MGNSIAVSVNRISKKFRMPHDRQTGLKGTFLNMLLGKNKYQEFYALKDISLNVMKGDFVGIIGRNGSGKSTLLKTIAGILKPTSGSVKVNGKIAPFLELGLGFQEELSGKDNVYLYGAVLGLSKIQIEKKYPEIVEFSELERFMDMKLKNYSSGMQARLAFSIATQAEGDILLIDEVLAVGDTEFQKKCYRHLKNLKKERKTILFVSHNLGIVEKYCSRVVYLKEGKLICQGAHEKIIKKYLKSDE